MAREQRGVLCPRCGNHLTVIPIIYGPLSPRQSEQATAGLIVMGGQPLYDDGRDPTYFCTDCELSFRPGSPVACCPGD